MAERHLLYLTHAGLQAWSWNKGTLEEIARFSSNDDGIKAFSAHLTRHPQTRYTLVADLADEAFHLETLPRLRGRDRSQLIARRQAQLHLDTPYVARLSLGREASGSRNERLLFAALTRPAAIAPWLDAFHHSGVALPGVHSATLLGNAIGKQAGPLPNNALLAYLSPAGLRISCLDHGQLRFSRLASHLKADTPNLWQAGRDEIQRTHHYLLGQRTLERNQPTPVFVLAWPDQLALLQSSCTDTSELRFTAVSLLDLSARCGLHAPPEATDSLPLVLHLAARTHRQPQFGSATERHPQTLDRIGMAIGLTAALLASASIVLAAKNISDTRQLHAQAAAIRAEVQAEEGRSRTLPAATPKLPLPLDTLQATLAHHTDLQHFSAGPAPFLHQLARLLDAHRHIELRQIDWSAPTRNTPTQVVELQLVAPTSIDAAPFIKALHELPGAIIDSKDAPEATSIIRASRSPSDTPAPLTVQLSLPPAKP